MATWRLLETGAGSGAWNMAVDEALLEAHRLGLAPPTLRLYRWEQPTLSLGYAQKLDAALAEACAHTGVGLVRRPTGGRAVLHAGDFTYSVVTSGLGDSVAGSYRALAGALAASLEALGLQSTLEPGTASGRTQRDCFASATQADLRVAGSKLVGSAQVRRAGALLQHGSLYLSYPRALAAAIFGAERPAVVGLDELLPQAPEWETVAKAFRGGFAAWGAASEPGELSAWERARVEESVRAGNWKA